MHRPIARWRVGALILAVGALAMAGLGPMSWLPGGLSAEGGRTALFWLGVACALAAAWGRGGT